MVVLEGCAKCWQPQASGGGWGVLLGRAQGCVPLLGFQMLKERLAVGCRAADPLNSLTLAVLGPRLPPQMGN